jgi:hypothetical protein
MSEYIEAWLAQYQVEAGWPARTERVNEFGLDAEEATTFS